MALHLSSPKEYLSEPSSLRWLLRVTCLTAGVYLGYMHARGIPIEQQGLEDFLTYAPSLSWGGVDALSLGMSGYEKGVAEEKKCYDQDLEPPGGVLFDVAMESSVGVLYGLLCGGFWTMLGYGAGYVAGKMFL